MCIFFISKCLAESRASRKVFGGPSSPWQRYVIFIAPLFFSFIISSFFQYSGEFHRPFLSDIIITSNLFPEYFFFIFFIQFPIHHDVLIDFFDMQIKTHQYETTGGLRRYGTQNVRGNVCRCSLRFGWRVDHRPAGPCHRLQFLNVLQPHAGNYAIHLFVLL